MDLGKKLGIEVKNIENEGLKVEVSTKLSFGSKPAGSFGILEELALQIALIQENSEPAIINPALLVFAGDHGITSENVSASQKKHTSELVMEFLNEGAAINRFARQSELPVRVIDVGVDHSFEGTLTYWLHQGSRFFNRKINHGTKNFNEYPAMTTAEMEKAMKVGMDMISLEHNQGCNTTGLGDVGVGNTTSASALCAAVLDRDPEEFSLQGSLDPHSYQRKLRTIRKALSKHPKTHDPQTLLTLFGGFEIAALVGAILRAAEYRMLILIDGFVTATAVLVASQICPEVRDYCIFCSGGEERGHKNLLEELDAKPLLNLNLRLGEGSGVSLAFPLIKNAVSILHQLGEGPNNEIQN